MGMLYFISTDGRTRVSMDMESGISISLPSSVSTSSSTTGRTVGHAVVEGNPTISAQGKVTYSKALSQVDNLNPLEFQREIQKSRRSQQKFTLYVQEGANPLLDSYRDCVISDVQINIGKSNAIDVSITFEQVFVTQAAKVSYLAPLPTDEAKANGVGDTENGGRGTKTVVEEKQTATIMQSFSATATGNEDFSFKGLVED